MQMRWGQPERKGEETMKKLFSAKGFTYLLTIVTLGLLLGASVKWHG